MLEIKLHKSIVGNLSHRDLVERVGLTREQGIIVHEDKQRNYDEIKVSELKEIIEKIQQAADEGVIKIKEKEIFILK